MSKQKQAGFGAIMAIIILVLLASLAAGIIKFGAAQQLNTAQDVLSGRALMAARAGNEYGLYQALKGGWTTCSGVSQTLDLSSESGFWVTVTCDSKAYTEGSATTRVYLIDATACNSAAGCPDAAAIASPGYIERKRQVVATN